MGFNIYKSTCALCHSINQRFVRVCIQDHLQILKKQMKEFMIFNPYSFLLMCENCVMKLKIFIKCDSHIYLSNAYRNMQESSQSQSKEKVAKNFEDTSCQCKNCEAKYGKLPFLADVIENLEHKDKSEQTAEPLMKSEKQNEINLSESDCAVKQTDKEDDTSKPSTSKGININKRIFSCNHCDRTFTHKGDYNKHLRKHTGEQPFECPVCNRKFAHTSNLARHLRVHSGDKPFHCERCNKSFSRKDKLLMHQKTRLCLNSSHQS